MDVERFKTLKSCSRVVTLPMELIFSGILPKLPAKSLLRFKCVSKSFLTEILSPKFNELFSEANRLFLEPDNDNRFWLYELDSLHSPPTICPFPVPTKWLSFLLACCESYILIGYEDTIPRGLILLNPVTRFYRILPKVIPTLSDNVEYGMCHCSDDEFNDDFKVVGFAQFEGPHKKVREVIVYSLRTNLWRTIECEPNRTEWCYRPILVQNHLLVMIFVGDGGRMTRIGCFDVKAERWSNDVLLPDIVSGEISSDSTRDGQYYLGALDGKLCFTWYNANKSIYSIWVMKECGVKSSWVKLMSFPVQKPEEIYHPIAYRKGSSHELMCIPDESGKYLWYNLRDKKFTETGFNCKGYSYLSFSYIYKGSLSNFPGGQPICSSSKEQEADDDDDDDDDCDYDDGEGPFFICRKPIHSSSKEQEADDDDYDDDDYDNGPFF